VTDEEMATVQTGIRPEYRQLSAKYKDELDALHGMGMFEPDRQNAAAEQYRRSLRRSLIENGQWLYDPLQTTGFVILTPMYVGAKAEALALLHRVCRGTSLRGISEHELIRRRPARTLPDGRPDDAWETVRTMFATLVADVVLQRRMKAGLGVRYAQDLTAATGEINALLREFVYTVGYDARDEYRTFYLIAPRNDERRQPVYARHSEVRHAPYESVAGPQYADSSRNAPSLVERRNRITLSMLVNS
jgi:hypothetical protein